MTAPIGPATRPIATIVAPWPIRSSAAERATPIRSLRRTTPAAPAAATNQATELTGPITAAAWSVLPSVSDRRIGNRFSKVTIAKPQNSSTPTRASSTRDVRSSPRPSPMTCGTARIEAATAATPRAWPMLVHEDQDRDQVDDAERERDEDRQGQGRDGVERIERHEAHRRRARPGRSRR